MVGAGEAVVGVGETGVGEIGDVGEAGVEERIEPQSRESFSIVSAKSLP